VRFETPSLPGLRNQEAFYAFPDPADDLVRTDPGRVAGVSLAARRRGRGARPRDGPSFLPVRRLPSERSCVPPGLWPQGVNRGKECACWLRKGTRGVVLKSWTSSFAGGEPKLGYAPMIAWKGLECDPPKGFISNESFK